MASSRFLSRLVVPCTKEVGKRMEASLPTLNRLLDMNAEQFDMEYGPNRFSNHMTHGLVALWSLGASDQTLEGFFEHYRRNTHPNSGYPIETLKPPAPLFSSLPPGVTVDEPSTSSTQTPTLQHFVPWSQVMLHWRGEGGNFSGLLAYFKAVAHRLVALGVDPTIEQATHRLLVFHAPHLLQGSLGGAFHGIIQIGYALEVGHQASVMLGLAYFTETYLSLGVPTEGPKHRHAQGASAFVFEPAEDLAKLREEVLKRYDGQLPEDVTREVKFVRRAERVRYYLKELLNSADLGLEAWFRKHYNDEEDPSRFAQVLDLTCQKITNAINRVYACSNDDFFVIHLITGWRSLRQVLKAFKAPPAPAAQSDSISDLIDNQEYARLVSSPKQLAFAAARMVDSYWRAVVVSYLCRGFPAIDASWFSLPDPQVVPSWEQIREHTLHLACDEKERALTDEHVYKIVHVLQQDVVEGYYSKTLFDLEEIDRFSRLLAARKAGILPWKLL